MKKALIIVYVLSMTSLSAQYLDSWWGGSVTGATSQTSAGHCVAHTISGEVYGVITAGIYQSSTAPGTNLDPIPGGPANNQVSTGPYDMFVNRVNIDGSYAWSFNVSGSLVEAPTGIVANGTSCYIVGYFAGSANFGGTTLTSTLAAPGVPSRDIFIARYNVLNGNLIWAQRFGTTRHDSAFSVAFDPFGNIVVVGNYQGSLALDPTGVIPPVVSSAGGGYDAFIASYDVAGNCLLAQTFGGPGIEHPHSVYVDGSDNIVIGGFFASNTCDFAPGAAVVTPAGGGTGSIFIGSVDAFVARYNPTATGLLFARTFGTPYRDEVTGVATDAANEIYFTGSYQKGVINFGGAGTLFNTAATMVNYSDILLGKYTTAGVAVWVRDFGSSEDDVASCISLDTYGRAWIAGYYQAPAGGMVDFNQPVGIPTISSYTSSGRDMFIASYDVITGGYAGSDRIPGTGMERIRDIDIYSIDYFLWATGQVMEDMGTVTFDVDPDPLATTVVPISSATHADAIQMEYRFLVMPDRMSAPTHTNPYPNPTTGQLFLDEILTQDVIDIFSIDGRLLSSRIAQNDGKLELNLSDLSDGIYLITVSREGEIMSNEKVVIRR